jgi:hypothetical protein
MKMRAAIAAAALCLIAGGAGAHHSAAMFDRSRPITVSGTVKEFAWTNPHTWIYMKVPNDAAGEDEWALEGASVSVLARAGWRNTTLKPGDKIKVLVAPRKDGSHGGEFLSVTTAEGKVLTFGQI